jgi:hypothetical protein
VVGDPRRLCATLKPNTWGPGRGTLSVPRRGRLAHWFDEWLAACAVAHPGLEVRQDSSAGTRSVLGDERRRRYDDQTRCIVLPCPMTDTAMAQEPKVTRLASDPTEIPAGKLDDHSRACARWVERSTDTMDIPCYMR